MAVNRERLELQRAKGFRKYKDNTGVVLFGKSRLLANKPNTVLERFRTFDHFHDTAKELNESAKRQLNYTSRYRPKEETERSNRADSRHLSASARQNLKNVSTEGRTMDGGTRKAMQRYYYRQSRVANGLNGG